MRFDEVATAPHGTIIRRASWPLHRWLRISGSGLPGHPSAGRTYEPSPLDQRLELTTSSVLVADALAHDWEQMSEPPIRVAIAGLATAVALKVGDQLVPLAEMPARHDGYRIVELLVPGDSC